MGERIGTAGWSIARNVATAFPADGTALERYSRVFNGVEVNSSFHRSHRPSTWEKWAQSVPDEFRFAVKLPKTITHQARLVDVDLLVTQFADEVRQLGDKLAVVLVQLPPKLAFNAALIDRFLATLRAAIDAEIACEPRNSTWFEDDADEMLRHLRVARVAADPVVAPAAGSPGGWRGLLYWRLHGSPKMYRSSYDDESIAFYAAKLKAGTADGLEPWCVFDNTAAAEATGNALLLRMAVEREHAAALSSASAT